MVLVLSIFLFMTGSGVTVVLPRLLHSNAALAAHVLFSLFLAYLVVSNYLSAVLLSPGNPSDYHPPPAYTGSLCAAGSFEGFSYCAKCRAAKPPGTHHCSSCGRCVPDMDHHW